MYVVLSIPIKFSDERQPEADEHIDEIEELI